LIKFYVLTLFPEFIECFKNTSIIKKGIDKKAYNIAIKNIREYSINRYGQVDDIPFGGGSGMLMRTEPIFEAYDSLNIVKNNNSKTIFFSPKGKKIDFKYINNLTNYDNIVLICGHYEGIDQRIIDNLVDDELSIGDFVLTGGEIPCMALIDATARLIDGVIKKESLLEESFTNDILEYRQYTRPREYRGFKVPDVLLSGNHKEIEKYKLEDAIRETLIKRRDLIENNKFSDNINEIIERIKKELES